MKIKRIIFCLFKPLLLLGYKFMGVADYAQAHTVEAEQLPTYIKYCLVLGAKVEYEVTPVLEQRLRAAIALAQARPDMLFVLSGTPQHGKYPSDVTIMQEYILAHSDIKREQLHLDYVGCTTWHSFWGWRQRGLPREFAVITNYFHMSRALFCGKKMGLQPYGIRLPRLIGPTQRYYLDRELAATYKVWLRGLLR